MEEFILQNFISIIIILFIVLNVKEGFDKGFLKKVLSLASIVISILITRFFTPQLVTLAKDYTNIEATITNAIYKSIINTGAFNDVEIPDLFGIFDLKGLNETMQNNIATYFADFILYIFCGIILFIGSIVVIKIVFKLLDILDYIPVVGQLNKLLGAVVGVFQATIIIFILFALIRTVSFIPQVKMIEDIIRQSSFAKTFYENNIIYNFFTNLFG